MATLNAVILPGKVLKDGKHKIRISVAHNGQTRYIVTDILIDSAKEFKKGVIIKRNDAAMLNTKLRGLLQRYQGIIDELEFVNGFTCSELVYQIKNAGNSKHRTFGSLYEEYMENATIKPNTRYGYTNMWRVISSFISENMLIEHFNHGTILSLDKKLHRRGLKSSTVRNYLVFVLVLLNYAKRCGYVQFKVDPFAMYEFPKMSTRDSWLTVEQIKQIRDYEPKTTCERKCRDLFMLSYYLGGINMVDLLKINFNEQKDVIRYVRTKTERKPKMNKYVEFEIPDEAKVIIRDIIGSDGYILAGKYERLERFHDVFAYGFSKMREALGIANLVFYSARKSFSQHAFDLGISTSVIDFILGHRVDKGGTALYSYISVTAEMATQAVRKVLDNLK